MSPKKGVFQKERIIFRRLFFRGHVGFRGIKNIKKAACPIHHLPFVSLQVLISTSEPVEAVLWAIYSAEETLEGYQKVLQVGSQ